MATAPRSISKPPVAIVVPKMENPSSMNSRMLTQQGQGLNKGTPVPEEKKTTGPSNTPNNDSNEDIEDSEMQLVSSLAKLQKLEAMIHQLRTLLPERLLEPLGPIVSPKATSGNSIPSSPQKLYEQLSQAARAGVAELSDFQNMWRSPEMKTVWDRVDAEIKENNGQLLQPTGVWEQDYDKILQELEQQDQTKKDRQQKAEEELERSKTQSAEGGWKTLLETFIQRSLPGVRVLPNNNDSSFFLLLPKAGLAFKIQTVKALQGNGVPEWQVASKQILGHPVSKLQQAILDCVNSRPRKWDLSYLLDMLSSYSNLKQTPCTKCSKMTDNSTHLPTIRRPQQTLSPTESQPITWEAYHASCI